MATMDAFRRGIRTIGLDLDGVVQLGSRPIEGAPEAIRRLRAAGYRVAFLTNNSARTRQEIADKLRGMGVDATPDDVFSSAWFAGRYLAGTGLRPVTIVGTGSLARELQSAGIDTTEDAATVLVGYKPDFGTPDVERVLPALLAGARFFACNLERTYPGEDGRLLPGCGAGVAAIAWSAARDPEATLGKPSPAFLRAALQSLGTPPGEFLMVGDSWDSDVGMALAAGCRAVCLDPSRRQGPDEVPVARDLADFAGRFIS